MIFKKGLLWLGGGARLEGSLRDVSGCIWSSNVFWCFFGFSKWCESLEGLGLVFVVGSPCVLVFTAVGRLLEPWSSWAAWAAGVTQHSGRLPGLQRTCIMPRPPLTACSLLPWIKLKQQQDPNFHNCWDVRAKQGTISSGFGDFLPVYRFPSRDAEHQVCVGVVVTHRSPVRGGYRSWILEV